MKIVATFPRRVRVIENVWIPLADGCRLAARLWLPEDAETNPVPAIIEYIPYRKRDGTRERDEPMHHYFAGHGYAAVRIDLRGSGDSDGLLLDEYLPQEQEDGVAAIAWVASQPWCSGRVGMMGKSWGGFNSLQIAALRPPALGAVIAVCATDDRYSDDAHYMGGCLLNENLMWGSALLALNAQPPDPALVGERWRAMWFERLENSVLFPEIWLRHPRRDDYWRHGSVGEDYASITCPVYAVSGWADGYSNAVPRLLAGLRSPRKGLVGPWAHVYPHQGVPGPAIGFLQETLRWWDHWLKGVDTGIIREPAYRVWMQESVQPRSFHDVRPGRWVAEERWPSERIEIAEYVMRAEPGATGGAPYARGRLERDGEGRPAQGSSNVTRISLSSPPTVGLHAGAWCGFGIEGEMPRDQREDDDRSLVFDSAPLDQSIEILGAPVVTLELDSDQPTAMIAVRLNDVAPGGDSVRVTYGLLNLSHREGHERLRPPAPGKRFPVTVQLNDVAHAFPAGHRLRVALSTSYWPVAWPAPRPVILGVFAGACRLNLPVREPDPGDETLPPFASPEGAPLMEETPLRPGTVRSSIARDEEKGETTLIVRVDVTERGEPALFRIEEIGLEIGHGVVETFTIRDHDPLSARAVIEQRSELRRGDWCVRVRARTSFRADEATFFLDADLEALEGEERVFERCWRRTIPRDGV